MQLCELLDRAATATGSDYKTAKALGQTPQVMSDWRAGRRTCTAEDRALIADIAGVDPLPEIAAALMERCEGKPKGERLKAVLLRRLEGVGNFYFSLAWLALRVERFTAQPMRHR